MIMNWFGNVLFARREKKSIVINLSHSCLSKMNTFMELFNQKHHESEWITLDDVAEVGIIRFCNKYIKLNFEEEEMPSAKPVVQSMLQPDVSGRRQLKLSDYRN